MNSNKQFLTKEAAQTIPERGDRQEIAVKFRPATEAEIKAIGDDLPVGYVAGWASTSDLDHYRHIVEQGAFAESIAEKGLDGPRGIKLLAQHRADKPAGKIVKLEYRPDGLWIEAQLNLNISYVKDLYEAAKMQGGLSFSVGFFLEDYEVVYKDDEYDHLLIHKGELIEVSVVTFPGNDAAAMTFIKSVDGIEFKKLSDFEHALVAAGIAKSRNDAARLTKMVKANVHLFQKAPPRLADTATISKLRGL
ncbi:MAG: HK97 family phage prohead protease, partial [Beijerinckiaceae bacterium]